MESSLSETRPALARSREAIERHRDKPVTEQLRQHRARWEVAQQVVDAYFEGIQTQGEELFSQDEIYPSVPLCVINIVQGVLGFTQIEAPLDSATLIEALAERLTSWSPEATMAANSSRLSDKVLA